MKTTSKSDGGREIAKQRFHKVVPERLETVRTIRVRLDRNKQLLSSGSIRVT